MAEIDPDSGAHKKAAQYPRLWTLGRRERVNQRDRM